jgi:hypothetical protein
MAEFSRDKAARWLERIGKRMGTLTDEQKDQYKDLLAVHQSGKKLDARQVKILTLLEKGPDK